MKVTRIKQFNENFYHENIPQAFCDRISVISKSGKIRFMTLLIDNARRYERGSHTKMYERIAQHGIDREIVRAQRVAGTVTRANFRV